ncbi:MAG: hypothetical protein P8Y44_04490 [Acidobacteriota bacterium]
MSETAESESERGYFRAIEETFSRLRGTPFLLSPADWLQAREWYRLGIPLELVLSTLESVFQTRAEAGKTSKVQSLRYCASAVEAAWKEIAELGATGARTQAPALAIAEHLHRLAESIPDTFENRRQVESEILSLAGTSEEIELALAKLDRQLLRNAFESMNDVQKQEVERRVESTITQFEHRLTADALPEIRQRLIDQTVREAAGLPFLSLFSPDTSK